MLRLYGLPERDLKLTGFTTDSSFNPKHISQVAVAPLIERPQQPNTGLHGLNASRPFNFVRFGCRP
jgi:hypothetical protein